jgi:hypothetical protein
VRRGILWPEPWEGHQHTGDTPPRERIRPEWPAGQSENPAGVAVQILLAGLLVQAEGVEAVQCVTGEAAAIGLRRSTDAMGSRRCGASAAHAAISSLEMRTPSGAGHAEMRARSTTRGVHRVQGQRDLVGRNRGPGPPPQRGEHVVGEEPPGRMSRPDIDGHPGIL